MTNENQEILEKVNAEYDDLKDKYNRLDQFINSEKFYDAGVSVIQAQYLIEQHLAMKSYLSILKKRIEDFTGNRKNNSKDDDQKDSGDYFDFSKALELLKNNYALSRSGWNGKEQSVYGVNFSNFGIGEFFILDDGNGKRNPWVPSTGDLMATDWFVAVAPSD